MRIKSDHNVGYLVPDIEHVFNTVLLVFSTSLTVKFNTQCCPLQG